MIERRKRNKGIKKAGARNGSVGQNIDDTKRPNRAERYKLSGITNGVHCHNDGSIQYDPRLVACMERSDDPRALRRLDDYEADSTYSWKDHVMSAGATFRAPHVDSVSVDQETPRWEVLDSLGLPNTAAGIRLHSVASMLYDNYTQREIGEVLGCSQPYVSQLVKKIREYANKAYTERIEARIFGSKADGEEK